ncbi:hypothetical protein Q5H92_12720 [Hymenobacter sp. M29]|uniref:Uncharacterized protein n=1 Tax=Hymenobacter mellowenesis TaxID=3063995 RepID=A0ABT9ABK1_9BACT|nr:hypothetical protein [Hymenobacter sp. M29]MDO7847227.1 hypothetical protein [Hymenobacter sp. M29]
MYTIVIDYKSGAYVQQVLAQDAVDALTKWIHTPHIFSIPGLGPASQQRLLQEIAEADNLPAPLNGLQNVWCTTFIIRGALMLVNIVCTVQ